MKKAIELANSFGYLRLDEVEALYNLAIKTRSIKDAIIVNIGAGAGTSGLAIYDGNPEAIRYTIDISPGGPLGGLEGERNAFNRFSAPYPIQILSDSKAAGLAWDKGKISLLFIDGGHSYDTVIGDINAWVPHVKVGGYIAFHDYDSGNWPEVKAAVDLLMQDYSLFNQVDTFIAFRKVKP